MAERRLLPRFRRRISTPQSCGQTAPRRASNACVRLRSRSLEFIPIIPSKPKGLLSRLNDKKSLSSSIPNLSPFRAADRPTSRSVDRSQDRGWLAAILNRSRALTAEARPTLATLWNLRSRDRRTLTVSWEKMTAGGQWTAILLVQDVLDQLCMTDPAVDKVFVQNAFFKRMEGAPEVSIKTRDEHSRFIADLINRIIGQLEKKPAQMIENLKNIGQKHSNFRKLGFLPQYWEKFADTFVSEISKRQAMKKYSDGENAWTLLWNGIVETLTEGYYSSNNRV